MKRIHRIAVVAMLGFGLLSLAAGCGTKATLATSDPNSKENPTFGIPVSKGGNSILKGTVTSGGEPVIAGRVLVFVEDGLCLTVGLINSDGTYECVALPDGKAEVVVLLDPDGGLPFPTSAPGAGGPPGGGPPGGGMKFPTNGGQSESGVNSESEETHRWLVPARSTRRSSNSRPSR